MTEAPKVVVGKAVRLPNLHLTSICCAEKLLCGNAIGNTERQAELPVLTISSNSPG
jgi:hypothetical protein